MDKSFKTTRQGFTLIELLVVIAIIGILASIVLASLNSARIKSRDARRVADIKQIQLALELYFDANRSYPTGTAALATGGFMPTIPTDPAGSAAYGYQSITSLSTLTACAAEPCLFYHLMANIEEDTNPSLKSDSDRATAAPFATGTTESPCGTANATDKCYDVTP